jgi:hypothetical protein
LIILLSMSESVCAAICIEQTHFIQQPNGRELSGAAYLLRRLKTVKAMSDPVSCDSDAYFSTT